jgi:antitoxin ParD1/3/4
MEKNISIMLENHFESFINSEISSGKYNSVNEVIHTALRLLEAEENRTKQLINKLKLGEQSPLINDFDTKQHLHNKLSQK